MTKKLLLTFALLLTAVTGAFADDSGLCGDVSYSYVESTNTLTISGTGTMADYEGSYEQPWKNYRSSIKTVVIGDGVTSIGKNAFNVCSGLTSITIPASVTSIGESAFNGCSNLTSITIPASVTSIGDGILAYCNNLATVTVDGGNTVYDSGNGCNAIIEKLTNTLIIGCKNSTIPVGVTTIGKKAFNGCSGLTSITIPASVTSIGESAFGGCSGLTSIEIPANVTTIGGYAFARTGLTSIEIPASVTSFGDYAFTGCSGLTTVSFAAGSQLTTIGNCVFNSCSDLTSITIPASVTSIGDDVFIFCSKLETMTVEDGNAVYDSRNGCNAIIEKSSNTLIIGCKNSTIPDGVTTIGDGAFSDCEGLTSIEIPASVTTIGEVAFCDCSGLSSVSFAAGSQLKTIGGYAFLGCEGLTSITIPASVTTIGEWAFQGCSNLATVTVYAPSCTLGENALLDCNNLANIYVFSDLVDYYQTATNWSAYADKITAMEMDIPHGNSGENVRWVLTGESPNYTLTITGTGDMENFATNSSRPWNSYAGDIKTVVIVNGVTSIGGYAFRLSGLTSITIPASVTTIGGYAFEDCHSLTTVSFAAGSQLTTIGKGVFSGCCDGLTSITIPASVTTIGESAFEYCFNLWSVSFADGSQLKTIGKNAFNGCFGLRSIEIPASVTTIGGYAFEDCSNLTTVTVFSPSCTLGVDAFMGCFKLTNIYVLSNYVGTYKTAADWYFYANKISVMFDGTSTTTVNIPNDVTVNGVIYNRTFTEGKPSTVMLPFSKAVSDISGGTFYTFGGVQKENDKWVATMKAVTGSIEANTPYLFMPTGTSLTFTGGATLNTTGGGDKETADQGSHWTFKGTYEYKEWISGGANAEEIGKAYGFAGVAKDGINVGDFVKVASGAKIRPMGCYLLWSDTPNASRAAARGAATEELPQSITVRLVSADGEVTSIDVRCKMEEGRGDIYYDLSGRLLQGKPTKKGLYINNGKKIVIK